MLIKSYSDFQCIVPPSIRSSSDPDHLPSKIWSVSFRLDKDISHLFPFINARLDDAVYYESPN